MSLRLIYPDNDRTGQTTLDIIAVHGFDSFDTSGSCSASSWCEPSGKPGDWLVEIIRTHSLKARLLLYEFKSDLTLRTDARSLSRQADHLLLEISNQRSTTDPHTPLIFLCHGLGGILVKHALVNASQNDHYHGIKTATRGLAFFGTPHQVPRQSSPGIIEKTLSFVSLRKPIQLPYNLELLTVQGFRDQVEDYRFVSFYGDSDAVVPFHSAVMNLAGNRETQVRLSSNHEGLCRFSIQSDNYRKVARNLLELCSPKR